jgi:hypothetical protein
VSHHSGFDVASILKGGECFGYKEESTGKEKGSGQEKSPGQEKSCHEKTVVFFGG